jgi:hypothetical protein
MSRQTERPNFCSEPSGFCWRRISRGGSCTAAPRRPPPARDIDWTYSAPIPELDQKKAPERLNSFVKDLNSLANDGWRVKNVVGATNTAGYQTFTTLYAILERD